MVDEKEKEKLRKELHHKKMTRILSVGITVVVLFLMLVCFGVFEHTDLPFYEDYYVLGGNCYSRGYSLDPMEVFREKTLPDGIEVSEYSLASGHPIDMDKLDTTVYYAMAQYCEANDYAVDECKIAAYVHSDGEVLELNEETEPEYRLIGGKLYVRCTVIGSCLDYSRQDEGKTWWDCEKENVKPEWICGATIGLIIEDREKKFDVYTRKGLEWIPTIRKPLDYLNPTNVCYVCLTLYVCIED